MGGGGSDSAGGTPAAGGGNAVAGSTAQGGATAEAGAGGSGTMAEAGTAVDAGTGGEGGAAPQGGAGDLSGGSAGIGGTGGAGGSGAIAGMGGGSGGNDATDDGCPLALEGFATLSADGQNGTYGGRDGETVTVTNQDDLNTYATAGAPYTIRVQGSITVSPKGTEIRVSSDKTIIGVGDSGQIVEGGFFLAEGVHNVILRNLTIRDTYVDGDPDGKTQDFDGVQMDTAHHVWIDHCHLAHHGDGLIDSRKDTTYLTVSWNILSDHNKAFGIGWTDNVTAQMTIHHNWLRDTNQRNPSVDNVLRAHLYNNFLQRISSYGNYARGGTNMVLENSVFEDVNDPHFGDDGSLVATGNIYRNTTGEQETFGSAFFNPRDFYDYTLDPASDVERIVSECAGPRPELGL